MEGEGGVDGPVDEGRVVGERDSAGVELESAIPSSASGRLQVYCAVRYY